MKVYLTENLINANISNEYYGWYKEPLYCNFTLNIDLSKYLFSPKKSFFHSIEFKSLILGNGANSFSIIIYLAENNVISTIKILLSFYSVCTIIYNWYYFINLFGMFMYYNLFSSKEIIIYLANSFIFISLDLDIQHFRYIYIFIPIIYLLQKKNLNEN